MITHYLGIFLHKNSKIDKNYDTHLVQTSACVFVHEYLLADVEFCNEVHMVQHLLTNSVAVLMNLNNLKIAIIKPVFFWLHFIKFMYT